MRSWRASGIGAPPNGTTVHDASHCPLSGLNSSPLYSLVETNARRDVPLSATSDPGLEQDRTLWSEQLGTKVKLHGGQNGEIRITITVNSLDKFEGILNGC